MPQAPCVRCHDGAVPPMKTGVPGARACPGRWGRWRRADILTSAISQPRRSVPMERRKFVWNGLLFTASLGLGACQHEYREEPYGRPIRRRGPPPHAPAHGYRHRYRRGLDLTFDSGLGVYLVVGALRAFYHDGRFYRFKAGDWWVSPDYHRGPWRKSSGRRLPLALRRSVGKWKRKEERREERERGRGHGRGRRDGY